MEPKNVGKIRNFERNADRNEMDGFDDSEGDGYGYDDDDYDHSHAKRNEDKTETEKNNLKVESLKPSSKEGLGEKMEKQESKNVDGTTALVGGGSKQEAKLNDDKSNVAVEDGKPKADLQSDEEKPNNKNDKVRINDGEAKKPAKTFKDTQKLEEGKSKESVGVKSDKNSKAAEEDKISSAEKNSGVEKTGAEAKESSKDDKAGFDRKSTDTLNKKVELKAEANDVREDRGNEKEDAVDRSRLSKLRSSDREKSDSDNSGTVKLTKEEKEEKAGLTGESSKKSESDSDPKIDEEGDETEAREDPEKLQASNRENYDSLASEDLSEETEDFRDNNSEDSTQLNLPAVKLEDTDYHKNFVKSLNRFKKKGYAVEEEPDIDRLIVRNLASEYQGSAPARKRIRSRKIRRTKTGNPGSYDLREISRVRSKFLNVLKERDGTDAASSEPRYRKRKSPKTLEFKIQIIDQNEAKTKNSETRSLREKKRIRFGQGSEYGRPEKPKSFHVGKKRLISNPETVGEKGKRDEDIIYAPTKMSREELDEEPKALVLVKKKQNGEKLTKTFVDGSAVKCLEDDMSSDDLAKILAQKKEYVVLKKVPSKNEYKVYGESEAEDKTQAKEVERNEEIARPERKQKIKYVSVDENELGTSEDADASQIRTKGFKSIEKKPPKVHEESSGLGELFKEDEEKKSEPQASQDPRYPGNENEGEKEIIYMDEKANDPAAKPKASKEEDPSKLSSQEKDFRAAIIKQSEFNREKAQRLQDKTQGKEVIIYNGGYGAKKPYADYKVPERIVNIRYRGPQINGKYPEKYIVFNDNLEPKHQIKIIKNDGIIPDDRIIETDRRIQSHKNHPHQGNRILDRPSAKNRFIDGETGAVYAVVKPSGAKKASLLNADSEEDYSSTKETSKRNSKAKDFFDGSEISGNFERFLKDFQELTEDTGRGIHRDRIRAGDDAAGVSENQIREIKSYGDANLKNLNKILEDLLKSQNEALNENRPGGSSKVYDTRLEDAFRIKEGQGFLKLDEDDPRDTESRELNLNLGTDPDEMDEDEFRGIAEDFQIGKRENSVGAVRKSRQLDVAPAETEETVLENQIQQILKNLKNNRNSEGKSRKKRESGGEEIEDLFGGTRKLLSLETRWRGKNVVDPTILELFGKTGNGKDGREKSTYNSFIHKREIDMDESVPNRLNDLLETSFAGIGNEKREIVKKDQPIWESNDNNEGGSDQIAEDGSNRDVGSDSVVEKRHVSYRSPKEEEEDLSLESDKVNFYDSDMMPSNEWKRGNDRLFGGREKIARNIKLKRSEKENYEPRYRSQRENNLLKRDKSKKPVHEKNEQFMIDKATFEDMIKKYLESGQGTEAKNQNEISRNPDVTYQHINIPKPSFQTTIDFTKLDSDHKNPVNDHKDPVKDSKMKILPTSPNSPPGSKDKNVKITFLNPDNPNYKQSSKGNGPSEPARKSYQEEDEKPSKESSLRDLAEIVRKLKNFFETKKIDLQEDSSNEAEPEIQNGPKNKFKEPYSDLTEEGRMRANKYLEFENDPESEFDRGDSENEEEEEEADDRAEDSVVVDDDETIEAREPADSASRLDENELSNKWSTFSNVYPKDDRKLLKSGNKNGLGPEGDKRAYFKDRRKQEILFDQDQYLGGEGNAIGFANENPKFFGKKFMTNINRLSSSDETEEKEKEKKINKWQGFRDEDQFIIGKEKRDFLSKNKALQGVHRHYPKNNRINNYEVRKVGNTLDTGSMKRNAIQSGSDEKVLQGGRSSEQEIGNGGDDDLDDDVIQNIIGGYILRKSTKIRPEQGLNSAGSADGKSKLSEGDKTEKSRSADRDFSRESNAFEKARKTLKRLSSGHMTEAHYRKYHRKNSGNKRGIEAFDEKDDQEDSFGETDHYQRSGQTGNARKSNSVEKPRNNIRITITSEETEDGDRGLKENRRKRYEPTPKEAAEEGFERVLADSKSVGRQTWSKSRSRFSDSESATDSATAPDGPLIVDLNEKIPWANEEAPQFRKETKRNQPRAETYFLLNKKKRSVGPDLTSSLAVSNHLDKLPITNRALPVKQINGGSEHQRKISLGKIVCYFFHPKIRIKSSVPYSASSQIHYDDR